MITSAKALPTPPRTLRFDITHHVGRIAVVEQLKGRTGVLTLGCLTIDSFETEQYLLFSAIDDHGRSVDHETCAKLFNVNAEVVEPRALTGDTERRLAAEVEQHIRATLNRSLEANSRHFNTVRERLDQWAEDKVLAAERALKDTKEQIKALRRQSRQAETLEEQHALQAKLQHLERRQRKQRQDIFTVEDEIEAKRDELIAGLEQRLAQNQHAERLFTIRWEVV